MSSSRRQAVVFPGERQILEQLGENIRLAMKRRRITQRIISERTGISKPTLRNIGRGEPTVSLGHYLRVLAVLGLAGDLAKVALDDELGRKLQDIALLKREKRPAENPVPDRSQTSERVKKLMAKARAQANVEPEANN